MSPSQKEKHFQELLDIASKLEGTEYDYVLDLIKNKVRMFPVALCHVHEDIIIERARLNPTGTLLKSEKEISYLSDPDLIKKVLGKYGRCNKPYSPVFYGSLESEEMRLQRATALSEVRAFYVEDGKDLDGVVCTIGRWRTKQKFTCPEIVFCDQAIAVNSYVRTSFQKQFAQLQNNPEREYFLKLIKFYSEQFGSEIPDGMDYSYKITAAISELFFQRFPGIVFPSVASEFMGLNIALSPAAVDHYLELEEVYTLELYSKGKHFISNNLSRVKNISEKNIEFDYEEFLHPTRATKEEIKKRFENQ